MTNAREELLNHVSGRTILCASVKFGEDWGSEVKIFRLKKDFCKDELSFFLDQLDFTYDAGYGGQELFGTIWYADGSWSERGEYDGSEWWEHKTCPEIPEELK